MTPDREDYLRSKSHNGTETHTMIFSPCNACELGEAFAHIDALRTENQKLKGPCIDCGASSPWDDHTCQVDSKEQEFSQLDVLIMAYRHAVSVRIASIKHNHKLRERIEKLRTALDKVRDPRKRDHIENEPYASIGCMMNIADEALAQDDESENKE